MNLCVDLNLIPKPLLAYGKINQGFLEISESKFDEMVSIIAAHLDDHIVNRNTVCCKFQNPFISVLFTAALWEHGKVPVLLNPELKEHEISEKLNLVKSDFLLVDELIDLYRFDIITEEVKYIFDIFLKEQDRHKRKLDPGGVILFTSGTTSAGKAVLLKREQLQSAYQIGKEYFQYTGNDSWLLSLPVHHISGFSIFYRAYCSDGSLIIPRSSKFEDLLQAIDHFNIDYISLVPAQLFNIIELNKIGLFKRSRILIGGGKSSPELISLALHFGLQIYKVYGSTETSAFVSVLSPDEGSVKPESSGKALPGVTIKIVDELGSNLPAGKIGRIILSAPGLTGEYLNAPEETAEHFHDGFFFTDDIGFIDEKGCLFVISRADDVINSGGKKINLALLQEKIGKIISNYDFELFAMPDEKWGDTIIIIFNGLPKPEFTFREFKKLVQPHLPAYEIPKQAYYSQSKLFNDSGKINRADVMKSVRENDFERL